MRYAVAGTLLTAVTVVHAAQDGTSSDASFEVASVRLNKDGIRGGYRPTQGRFTTTGMSVIDLVSLAYGIPAIRVFSNDGPYLRLGPEWTRSEGYDINATRPAGSPISGWAPSLRRLLEERFALRWHREEREVPVYLLVRARPDGKLGRNLIPIDDCQKEPKSPLCGRLSYGAPGASVSIESRDTWPGLQLADHLGRFVSRTVVDRTGIIGSFELKLQWAIDSLGPVRADGALNDQDHPSLFVALEEQLGLKLESSRASLQVFVIDHVQRPSPD
jgi:uncharacterized protein (TIGR03435 family)